MKSTNEIIELLTDIEDLINNSSDLFIEIANSGFISAIDEMKRGLNDG